MVMRLLFNSENNQSAKQSAKHHINYYATCHCILWDVHHHAIFRASSGKNKLGGPSSGDLVA